MSVPPLCLESAKHDSHITSTDVEEALNRFIAKKELPPYSMKPKVLQLLDRLRVDAATNRFYKDAAKYQQLTKDLQQQYIVEQEMEKMRTTSRRINTTRSELQSKLGSTNQQYNQEIENYKKRRAEELQRIIEQHETQIQEFTNRWKESKQMTEFSKPSPQLLQLRDIEKKQVLLGDYSQAEETKVKAGELEKEEIRKANERAIMKMKTDYGNLLKKQEAEVDIFQKRTEIQVKALETQQGNQAGTFSRCLRLSEPFPRPKQKTKHKISPERAQMLMKIRTKSEIEDAPPDVSLATPRTYKKIMDMRSSSGSVRLGLDGIDITQHIKRPQRSLSSFK